MTCSLFTHKIYEFLLKKKGVISSRILRKKIIDNDM